MPFRDDGGGFAFDCDDLKFSAASSTWNMKLSQIGKLEGAIRVMTHGLPNPDYIAQIIQKRPHGISIIAHRDAEEQARIIKRRFPDVEIGLHDSMNAKAVFVEPHTVWVSSADFGESKMDNSAIGLHSRTVHDHGLDLLFWPAWKKAQFL